MDVGIEVPASQLVKMTDDCDDVERKKESILSSERFFQTIFETSGCSKLILDHDGYLVLANSIFEHLVGLDSDYSGEKHHVSEFIHDDSLETVLEYHRNRRISPESVPRSYEARVLGCKGEVNDVVFTVSMLPGTGFSIVSAMDVTDHKKIERALLESEERYRNLVSAYPEPIIIHSGGKPIFINEPCLALMGIESLSDAAEKPAINLICRDYQEIAGIQPGDYSEEKSGPLIEEKLICEDGSVKDMEISTTPVWYDSNLATQIILRDVTSRNLAEKEIRSKNLHFSILNQIISVANSSIDLTEMASIVLKKMMHLLDFDVGVVFLKNRDGSSADVIYYEGAPERYIDKNPHLNIRNWPYNIVFFAGQPRYVENLPDCPPGRFDTRFMEELGVISIASIPLIADSVVVGAVYLGRSMRYSFSDDDKAILESIGKEVGSSIIRAMLQDEVEESLSETSMYLEIMVNDLGVGISEILEQTRVMKCTSNSDSLETVDRIRSGIIQISETLNNIKTIRNLSDEKANLDKINLDDVISGEIAQFPDVRIFYENTGIHVYADNHLAEIFVNLIGNSIKFGGMDVKIWMHAEEQDGNVQISVEDTGPGIPDEKKENLFCCFRRNTRRPSSQGLGFHIIRILIERYGGKIRLDDRVSDSPGEGLAVRFSLEGYTRLDIGDEIDEIGDRMGSGVL